jgi:hypothetical protein
VLLDGLNQLEDVDRLREAAVEAGCVEPLAVALDPPAVGIGGQHEPLPGRTQHCARNVKGGDPCGAANSSRFGVVAGNMIHQRTVTVTGALTRKLSPIRGSSSQLAATAMR